MDPYVTIIITKITSIALAISVEYVNGNAIVGMVLAIVKPFEIGDPITAFEIAVSVEDNGLFDLYLNITKDRKIRLVPNGTMLGTAITREKIII